MSGDNGSDALTSSDEEGGNKKLTLAEKRLKWVKWKYLPEHLKAKKKKPAYESSEDEDGEGGKIEADNKRRVGE